MIIEGDCVERMAAMPDASVDAIVTDPPYGLEFMGRSWDSLRNGREVDPAFAHWFAGFVDGEGCFSVHKKRIGGKHETYDCQFAITLRADDRPILERIRRALGIGTLTLRDRTDGNAKPQARYCVSAQAECLILRDLLRMAPLRAKKAADFEVWSDALSAWVQHEPGDGWKDVADLRDALMAGRAYTDEGVRVSPEQIWHWRWAREALRVLKPGGHLLAFGGTRTYHRLACAIEDAGFEIRDTICWLYGSGFPKSLDVGKAIDKAEGAEREVVGSQPDRWTGAGGVLNFATDRPQTEVTITNGPATPEAERWDGWGTALKPAHEPIVVARKPLTGTVAGNVLEHGTGGLNIDGCRIGMSAEDRAKIENMRQADAVAHESGRWPANVVLAHDEDCVLVGQQQVRSDGHFPSARPASGYGSGVEDSNGGGLHGQDALEERHFDGELVERWACVPGCPVRMLDDQVGQLASGKPGTMRLGENRGTAYGAESRPPGTPMTGFGDRGGASRFFYCAKAGRAERDAGLDGFDKKPILWSSGEQNPGSFQADGTDRAARNPHPTVKPIDLMRWLVRLVTPPGGTVLDPFAGSGTTGIACVLEGFDFIGVEREADYVPIAEARIRWWEQQPAGVSIEVALAGDGRRRKVRDSGQDALFS